MQESRRQSRKFSGKRVRSISRLLRKRTSKKISRGRHALDAIKTINELKSEVALLTSYSTDVIYRLRYDGMKYDYISPSVTKLLGYSCEEMQRINIRALIVETKIVNDGMKTVESFDRLEDTRKKGEVSKWQADYLMKTKDGRRIWVSDISYPWFDDDGSIVGSVGSLRDIGDRIDAETKVKEELKRIANTDPLTGISNRRVFFEKSEDELKRIRRGRGEFSMLLLDIDHFKKINDSYGHDIGDFVLIEITKVIKRCLREIDVPARMGGEEFAIFLPETNEQGAFQVAERVRGAIAKHTFMADAKQNRPIGCTVSIGITTSRFDEETDATKMYKMADTRLYIAKNSGRNQVCGASPATAQRPNTTPVH
ncbi:MAG: sensor domain-containing diguanylate cyclase [Alphaproteobacteria bacterium]|nr:sensor domain-containing diguanylate cyclase [Alphaproteobacteria bacterium]